MHPHMGCEKGFDKLGVTLECVAQDLEYSESAIEDSPLLHGSLNNSGGLTITEVTSDSISADCSSSPVRPSSLNHLPSSASAGATNTTSSLSPSVSNFSAMANFNNGFTFPSPSSVVATMSSPSSCSPYSGGQQNGVLMCPTSTVSISTIQFPTPSSSGVRRYSDCTSVSASWGLPTRGGQPPMSFSGIPNRVQQHLTPTKFRSKISKKSWKPAASMCMVHGKRKADLDPYDADQGRKIRINEDRMAARMQDLHLDNNNLEWHPNLEEETWYSDASVNNNEQEQLSVSDIELDSEEGADSEAASPAAPPSSQAQGYLRLPRLELAEELQLDLKTRELLPRVFLEELKKPSMQLVLWKPPEEVLKAKDFIEKEAAADVDVMDMNEASDQATPAPPQTWSPATFDSLDDDMEL